MQKQVVPERRCLETDTRTDDIELNQGEWRSPRPRRHVQAMRQSVPSLLWPSTVQRRHRFRGGSSEPTGAGVTQVEDAPIAPWSDDRPNVRPEGLRPWPAHGGWTPLGA